MKITIRGNDRDDVNRQMKEAMLPYDLPITLHNVVLGADEEGVCFQEFEVPDPRRVVDINFEFATSLPHTKVREFARELETEAQAHLLEGELIRLWEISDPREDESSNGGTL